MLVFVPQSNVALLIVNRLKINIFRECALKIAVTRSNFQPKIVWLPGSARTRWGSLQRSPRPFSYIETARRLASRLRRSETERSGSSFFHSNTANSMFFLIFGFWSARGHYSISRGRCPDFRPLVTGLGPRSPCDLQTPMLDPPYTHAVKILSIAFNFSKRFPTYAKYTALYYRLGQKVSPYWSVWGLHCWPTLYNNRFT